MPRTSNEGRRRLCAVLTTVGVGSETLAEGRKVAAKLRWSWGRCSRMGVCRGWGEAKGSGKGGEASSGE